MNEQRKDDLGIVVVVVGEVVVVVLVGVVLVVVEVVVRVVGEQYCAKKMQTKFVEFGRNIAKFVEFSKRQLF